MSFEKSLILNSSLSGTSRLLSLIDDELSRINKSRLNRKRLTEYMARMIEVMRRRSLESGDDSKLAKALSAIGLFRYEYESRNQNYQGTFILSEEVRRGLPNEGIYLEMGMGPGDNIITLARKKREIKVYGSDISPSMVARAQKSYPDGRFFAGDAQCLPLNEESVDVAIICNALDRIPTARATIQKIGTLVKKGGYLVVAQCDPFQNEFVENGFRFVYVPKAQRLSSVDEAVKEAGLELVYRNTQPFEWNIKTLLYGQEKLNVNVGVGRKPTFEEKRLYQLASSGKLYDGSSKKTIKFTLDQISNLVFYLKEEASFMIPEMRLSLFKDKEIETDKRFRTLFPERVVAIRSRLFTSRCTECSGRLWYTEQMEDEFGKGRLWCNKCDNYYPV